MKLYTKKGDTGRTKLFDGTDIEKYDLVLDVLGNIDELTSNIGMVCALLNRCEKIDINEREIIIFRLRDVQKKLQYINSYIATKDEKRRSLLKKVIDSDVKELENWIDDIEVRNIKLVAFILPGVTVEDAQIHICRTICRRSERYLCKILCDNLDIMSYMNRLSDFLFCLARYVCKLNGQEDLKI